MTNLSELFPQSASLPAGMSSNPNHLPVYETNTTRLFDSAVISAADAAAFWNELAKCGAYVTGAVDDTYKEICSLTGSGNLFHVIPPAHTNTSDTIGFRITVDGTVYEILKTQTWQFSNYDPARVVMGAGSNNHTKYSTGQEYFEDFSGSQSTTVFSRTANSLSLLPPAEIMCDGLPSLRFEESLIVEAKVTDVKTGTYGPRCGASYIMN